MSRPAQQNVASECVEPGVVQFPIYLSFPIPPSANRNWRARKGSTKPTLSPKYRAWLKEAGYLVKIAEVGAIKGKYEIQIFIPAKMRGDADNRIKPILDLLKGVVTDDDKNAEDVRITRNNRLPNGICNVVVRPATITDDTPVAIVVNRRQGKC